MRGRIYRLIPKGHDGSYRVPAFDLGHAGRPDGGARLAQPGSTVARHLAHQGTGPQGAADAGGPREVAGSCPAGACSFSLAFWAAKAQKHVRAALTDCGPRHPHRGDSQLETERRRPGCRGESAPEDPSPQVRRELLLSLRESDAAFPLPKDEGSWPMFSCPGQPVRRPGSLLSRSRRHRFPWPRSGPDPGLDAKLAEGRDGTGALPGFCGSSGRPKHCQPSPRSLLTPSANRPHA